MTVRAWRYGVCLWALSGCVEASNPSGGLERLATEAVVNSPAEAVDEDPADDVVHVRLTAAPHTGDTWAYNGQIPGPTIRSKVGDTVKVTLTNNLPNPTTIHWHGVEVPFEMDGVIWKGAPIAAGEVFEYSFEVRSAGTFWYHPHFDTRHQVDLGLYGAFIVEDPSEPATDRDLVVVFDQTGESVRYDTGPAHRHGLVPVDAPWTVNGVVNPTIAVAPGERVRLRTLNASNTGYVSMSWPNMRHIANDQGLLSAVQMPQDVLLAPGDRAEFELIGEETGFEVVNTPYSLMGGEAVGDKQVLFRVVPDGAQVSRSPVSWPSAATPPSIDPGYADAVYVFSGSSEGGNWMINGERFPDVTIEEFQVGQSVVLEVRNLSPSEHPFHMHGHSFEVLSRDGVPPAQQLIEDTINVGIREIVRLRFTAANVGDWMTHCHILEHADEGMMTIIRVNP